MPFFQNETELQRASEAVKVDFGDGSDITLFVDPRGPQVKDTTTYTLLLQRAQTAAKHLTRIERLLKAGTLSEDEYQQSQKELGDIKAKADQKKADNPDAEHEYPEADYKQHLAQLDNAFHGQAIMPDEFEKLSAEQDKWKTLANMKGNAIRYLLMCVIDWDYYLSKADFDKGESALPVTEDNLKRFSEDRLLIMSGRVIAHYRLLDEKGKKSQGSSPSDSATPNSNEAAASLNGQPDIQSPCVTDSDPATLTDGQNANTAKLLVS